MITILLINLINYSDKIFHFKNISFNYFSSYDTIKVRWNDNQYQNISNRDEILLLRHQRLLRQNEKCIATGKAFVKCKVEKQVRT